MTIRDIPTPNMGVIELRRTATTYLDHQGKIAQLLLDNYDAFTVDPSPVRLMESLVMEDLEHKARAIVNGQQIIYQQLNIDIDTFERNSRVFFRLVEEAVDPPMYERVGVLFAFGVSTPDPYNGWLRSKLEISGHPDWSIEDANLRLTRLTGEWDQILSVRRWLAEDLPASSATLRVDVDQYKLQVPQREAWNVPVGRLFSESFKVFSELAGEETHNVIEQDYA